MKILAMVLAGGEGTRLRPLTSDQAKPAVRFANGYRLIDFALSNLCNSRISKIYVLAQYKPNTLIRHIHAVWKPWSMCPGGFVQVLLPQSDATCDRFAGTADAVCRNMDLIERHQPDLVAVLAADHVYRMDFRQMASFHRKRRAEVTVAAVAVPIEHACAFGIMITGADGRIHEFQEKPAHPAALSTDGEQAYASMGNYLFEPAALKRVLTDVRKRGGTDFGRDVLPTLPGMCRVFAYDFAANFVPGVQPHEEQAYWRDVGTLDALNAARKDVIGLRPRFNLWNHRWPIRGEGELMVQSRGRERDARPQAIDIPVPSGAIHLSHIPDREQRTEFHGPR